MRTSTKLHRNHKIGGSDITEKRRSTALMKIGDCDVTGVLYYHKSVFCQVEYNVIQ